MIYHKKLIYCEFLSKQMSYVESIHLYGSENMANTLFHMGHPDSLVTKELLMLKNKQTVKSWSLVFWFIFKEFALVPRVKFPTCYSKMKCQNIFQFLALFLFFFCLPCFVLSYLFITAYIWHCCKCFFCFFFSDFCSSNICFLSVASGGAIISFHSATKTFDILI